MRGIGFAALLAFVLVGTPLAAGKAGDLDSTFDGDGKVVTDFAGFSDIGFSVQTQSDGKIVLVGSSGNETSSSFALARYAANGALDPTFDGDGRATASLTPTSIQIAYAAAIQPDGKILAAGTVLGTGRSLDFAAFRFNGDGSLDASFDGDGKVATDLARVDEAVAIALEPDGKIVLAGRTRPPGAGPFDIGLARYNQDGSLDTSFDGDGTAITAISEGSDDHAYAVAVQPDGRILAGGSSQAGGRYSAVLVRYKPDGTLDSSFDGDGKVVLQVPTTSSIYALALQRDGKIVTVGEPRFTVSRFNADGSLDTTFAGDGNASSPFSPSDGFAVAVQSDGKIVAAGGALNDVAVARFNAGGALDQSFGSGGGARADFGARDGAYGVQLLSSGQIVVAGYTGPDHGNGPNDFAVARFQGVTPVKPKPKKVTLCHKGKTIKVPKSQVRKHRKHGDKVGRCKKKKKKRR